MTDFAAARRMMVDGQVRTSDVTDRRIIAAMLELPRERFVAQANADLAYLDLDVPVARPGGGGGRRLLKPMVLAKMVHAAAVREADQVLDVGCASGYSSALLARLAACVVALEEDPALTSLAEANLGKLAAGKATVVTGSLTKGWPPRAPYDVIFLNGASEIVPRTLFGQLKNHGRLIAVIGRAPTGRATLYRSIGGEVSGWPVFDAVAQILPGFAAPAQFVF
jgi:protein-L-isoaspartate(D-aspartate) O-methyltransferase